jgi:hypothetical protein
MLGLLVGNVGAETGSVHETFILRLSEARMIRIALVVLALLTLTFASASPVAAGRCDMLVDHASKTAASISMGEVIAVGEPREVNLDSKTEKLYVTKFFVWERWKGPKSLEAEVLTEIPFHYGLPQMRVGSVYLVYAFPVFVPDGTSIIEGVVTHYSPTIPFSTLAYLQIFELDRIFKPRVTQRTSILSRPQHPNHFCLVCCF